MMNQVLMLGNCCSVPTTPAGQGPPPSTFSVVSIKYIPSLCCLALDAQEMLAELTNKCYE